MLLFQLLKCDYTCTQLQIRANMLLILLMLYTIKHFGKPRKTTATRATFEDTCQKLSEWPSGGGDWTASRLV